MRIRWRGFELPTRLVVDRETVTSSYGKFIAEPFERGYGHTIGNSLRRVLLSSLEGAAVTWIRIEGISHEFTAIPGCREDTTEVVLNLKQLLVSVEDGNEHVLRIDKSGEGPVTGGDVETNDKVTVVNPDMVICELTSKGKFKAEIGVQKGRGYKTAEELSAASGDTTLGTIPIDASFSPVRRVRYSTENARVGQKTDYDRLVMEIWTNGAIRPEDALAEAGMILRKHLNPFVKFSELGKEIPQAESAMRPKIESPADARARELKEKLSMSITALDPSVRATHCLEAEGIKTLGELCERTEADMLKIRNFGKTSLRELKKKLEEMGLSFGMQVPA